MRRFSVLALVGSLLLGACASDDPDGRPAAPDSEVPQSCDVTGGDRDQDFWEAVTAACRVSDDGDRRQGRALREILSAGTADEVATFHRTMVRLHRRLLATDFQSVADELCFPGLGLGQDLGADYRSWVVAQGQAVFEWVEADPKNLLELPGARRGCGLGEFVSYAAVEVHEQKTAGDPTAPDLAPLELLAP